MLTKENYWFGSSFEIQNSFFLQRRHNAPESSLTDPSWGGRRGEILLLVPPYTKLYISNNFLSPHLQIVAQLYLFTFHVGFASTLSKDSFCFDTTTHTRLLKKRKEQVRRAIFSLSWSFINPIGLQQVEIGFVTSFKFVKMIKSQEGDLRSICEVGEERCTLKIIALWKCQ